VFFKWRKATMFECSCSCDNASWGVLMFILIFMFTSMAKMLGWILVYVGGTCTWYHLGKGNIMWLGQVELGRERVKIYWIFLRDMYGMLGTLSGGVSRYMCKI